MDDFNEKLEVEILWEFFGLVGVALAQDYADRQKFESIVPNTLDESLCDAAKMTEKAICDYLGEYSSDCMVAHAAAVVACLFENNLTKAHQYFQNLDDESLTCVAAKLLNWQPVLILGVPHLNVQLHMLLVLLYAKEIARYREPIWTTKIRLIKPWPSRNLFQ